MFVRPARIGEGIYRSHWTSDVDANVWEPGATGTESLWTEGA